MFGEKVHLRVLVTAVHVVPLAEGHLSLGVEENKRSSMACGGTPGQVICAQACGGDGLQITLRNKDAVNKVGCDHTYLVVSVGAMFP